MRAIEISQDADDSIWLQQDLGDELEIIILSPSQALALAYRLLSFAKGQGPRATEIIENEA